jgi:hypothetical protein
MKVHAERAMASGSPIGSELSAVAGHDGEWLCLRTVGYARNLAWGECPDRAEAISAALDEALIRVWRSGEARALPAIDENVCRTLLFRARAELFAAPGQASTLDASDLRLIDRGN